MNLDSRLEKKEATMPSQTQQKMPATDQGTKHSKKTIKQAKEQTKNEQERNKNRKQEKNRAGKCKQIN